MTIDRTDILIRKARKASQQDNYDEDRGIPQEFFINSLNECNQEINKILVAEASEPFAAYSTSAIVANQEAYAVPTDIFSSNLVYSVEYSADSATSNWQPLDLAYRREYVISGEPDTYFVDNGYIYISPVPQSANGSLRIRYEKRLDNLDIPRGVVSSVGVQLDVGTQIQLNISDDILPDESALIPVTQWEYACFVDGSTRLITRRNCPRGWVGGYDTSSGIITIILPSEYTDSFQDIIDNASNSGYPIFLLLGADTTCFSPLPRHFQNIFLNWMANDVQLHLSSLDLSATKTKYNEAIVKAAEIFAQLPSGKKPIPEHRRDWY
jgi:hypothetical protein